MKEEKKANKLRVKLIIASVVAVILEVVYSCCTGYLWVDRALALFALTSSCILLLTYKKCPQLIRGICRILGILAVIFVAIGMIVKYELIPYVSVWMKDNHITFTPAGTVFTAFCGGILGYLPDDPTGKDAPADKKEEVTK